MRSFLSVLLSLTLLVLLSVSTVYTASATATQVGHWRWRNDDGTETSASWQAAMDAQTTITDPFKAVRLRMSIYSNSASNNGSVILQYTTSQAAATPGSNELGDEGDAAWIDVPQAGTSTTAAFTLSASSYISGSVSPTTSQLGVSSTASSPNDAFNGGILFTTNYASGSFSSNRRYEVEFTIKPTATIQNNTVYYFRFKGTLSGSSQVPDEDNYLNGVPKLLTGPNVRVTHVTSSITALLGGAYDPATSEMTTALAMANLLPQTKGSVTIPGINTLTVGGKRVTDWVTVEISKAAAPAVPLTSYTALLLGNGKIVSSTSPYNNLVFTQVPGDYVVTVRQRNHLAVATRLTITTATTSNIDFTTAATTAQKTSGAVKMMWQGDTDQDGEIGSADVSAVISSFTNGDFDAYLPGDLNLDTETGTTDVGMVKTSFLQGVYFDYGAL